MTDLPLLLLPGMGVDAQVFALQRLAFPQLRVPDWIPPHRGESLADYAARFADHLKITEPCLVGGISFGGLVALELTHHLPARGCVLISSLRGHAELPLWCRIAGVGAWMLPSSADRWVAALGRGLLTLKPILPGRARALASHLSKTRSPLLAWACEATVGWRGGPAAGCPVFQIHGSADPIFPLRWVHPDQVVDGGGHVLTLSHPYVINGFLRDVLSKIEPGPERELQA